MNDDNDKPISDNLPKEPIKLNVTDSTTPRRKLRKWWKWLLYGVLEWTCRIRKWSDKTIHDTEDALAFWRVVMLLAE